MMIFLFNDNILKVAFEQTWVKPGMGLQTFTKPPLFQRNRLTGSGNPSFESHVEEKAQQRENEGCSRSSFQIPHDCTLFTEA
jgi:hypothetical protein